METGKKQDKRTFVILVLILVVSLAYTSYGADTAAPHPRQPQTWRFFPAPSGQTSITMQATRCYDSDDPNTPPVWYWYECTTAGHTDINSGWIQGDANVPYDANTIWTATGLDPNTSYSFKYRARDSADPCNMTNWSPTKSAKTDRATTPALLRLDFNAATAANDNNALNNRPGYTSFLMRDSGTTIGGITVDLASHINEKRNTDPCGTWFGLTDPNQEYYQRAGETLYQDMIFGIVPNGIKITLWGLGVNQDCNLTLFAYDDKSTGDTNRVAHWFSNGTSIFDTNFIGGVSTTLRNENDYPADFYKWAYSKRVTADAYGRIVLTSTLAGNYQPFSFINALTLEPNYVVTYVPTPYATRPQPINEEEDVNVARLLQWRNGAGVSHHDLYLGTNFSDVNDADRSNPHGVLIGADLAVGANTGYDPCRGGPNNELLALNTTYYWRVDENDPGPIVYEGEVWRFSTLPFFMIDDFNSYATGDAMAHIWKDYRYQTGTTTTAQIVTATDPNMGGPPYQSMEYQFLNKNSPYYAEVNATIGTGTNDLKIDPNWSGMNAKALSLWFYGKAGNDANKPMYVTLVDSDTPVHTKKVLYNAYGDMNDINKPSWHEWNIPLADFTGVNLTKVKTIVIGFGDKTKAATNGTVWFENIVLWTTRCALAERDADFALLDYSPSAVVSGDCVIDYQELATIADTWLSRDARVKTKNPGDASLVVYYPFNEANGNPAYDGNRVYSHPDLDNPDACDARMTGTFYQTWPIPPGNVGTSWSTDHAPGIGGTGCIYINGEAGSRVSCGTYGQAGLGIGPPPAINAMTLSIWAKWLGPRTFDPDGYLQGKSQGFMGKRGGWDETHTIWTFWISANYPSALGLGRYDFNVESAEGTMDPFIGKWVHVAVTVNGNHAIFYLNGGKVNIVHPDPYSTWSFSYGCDNCILLTIGNTTDEHGWYNGPSSFYGYLDEARIYNRALEPSEIAYLADTTPADGNLYIPIASPAELYKEEPEGQRVVNFKDFALVVNQWLKEEMFPR